MGTDLNIGHVTAYAYAKSKGYTGTEEQFATELAHFAENAQQVAEDRAAVEQLVDEFLNTTAPAVIQDVTDEGTSQVERVVNAGTAQVTRVGEAGNTQIDAVAAAGTTQIGLVTAEGTTQVTRVQDKGDEVIDSIPADYTALTQEVSDLNRQLSELLPLIKVKSLVFNKFGLNTANGFVNSKNDRLHSAIASAKSGDIISVPDGFSFWVAYYTINGFSGNSYDELGKWSKGSAIIAHDGLFSINVKKDDESVFTDADCYNLNYKAHLYSTAEERVNDIVFGVGHIMTNDDASVWSLHGDDYYFWSFSDQKTLNTTRWRTENKTLFLKGTTIEVKSGYRFYIFAYADGYVINGTWLTGSYTFGADTIARIIVDTVNSEKVPYTEWPSLNEIVSIQNSANNANNLSSEEELYIGEFINGHLTASGVIDDNYTNYRISTPAIVAFPYGDKTILKITITSGYLFAIRTGATANNLNNNLYWFKNGDTINLPDGCNYYALSICRDSTNPDHIDIPITPADDIGLKVSVQKNMPDVVTRNVDAENILSNARLFFSASELNTINKYAIIGHTSDCHGDYTRVNNFLSFCDSCGADVACITGDIVSYKPSQQIKWFNDLLLKHDVLPAVCTGNHDVYGNTLTDDDIYSFMFADVAEKIGNTTGKTWYYTDIAKKKIRIVSVNLYQYGGENRWYTHFTDEQLAWIVSTMASTPSGYGIIILTHASQVSLDNAKDSNYDEFFQDVRLYNTTHNSVSGGVPLYDIIDAFISRTTLSKTYAQTGTPSSITVSADFTNVDTSVEFIAHLTGHFHQDSICYVPNRTNKQLMLNVTCTNAIYGGAEYPYLADLQDQARYNMDVTQDAFNVYIIDRDNKTVKVTRIGSNKTYQMKNRQYMEIPYSAT